MRYHIVQLGFVAIIIDNVQLQTRASEEHCLKAQAQHRFGPVAVEHGAPCYTSY